MASLLPQQTILITGSEGLIGSRLTKALEKLKFNVRGFDIRAANTTNYGDICDADTIADKLESVTGIVHLAAVSRVIWGERDPKKCRQVNVTGTEKLLQAAYSMRHRPWVIYAVEDRAPRL